MAIKMVKITIYYMPNNLSLVKNALEIAPGLAAAGVPLGVGMA